MNDLGLRIIIIDDNPAIHQDFIKVLTVSESSPIFERLDEQLFGNNTSQKQKNFLPNFQIDTADQGREGVDKIKLALEQGRPYALAFVDIRMPPGWDGLETIMRIWKIDPDIQVVICTAYSDYSWEETIQKLGMNDNLLILKKPFDKIAVRQLACALTRKWLLAKESKSHTESLYKIVSERTESLQQSLSLLEHQATHDSLTDLPNRVLLTDRMQQTIATAIRRHQCFAVLFFDLDRFKLVNDSLSHKVGDELLLAVAKRLSTLLRKEDTLARLGGDEFVMIIPELIKTENIVNVVQKILMSFSQPFRIAKREIMMSTSIGISLYPSNGKKINTLLKNADLAMYHAKEQGGNQFKFYTPKLNHDISKRLQQETELRQAIINNEFFLLYQPQFDMNKHDLVGVEALLRWQHPQKGTILPLDFIPTAEESGLIVPIGEWVIHEVCKQIQIWQNNNLLPPRISINVATQQLKQTNFASFLDSILKKYQVNPEYLEIEITENVIITHVEIRQMIQQIKKIGVQIVLDDFGTGNSSLNYLKKIHFDRLKIDQSFVQNIAKSRSDEVIIEAIIAMARSFNFKVLAEGVETQNQIDFLKDQNCDGVQGFLLSKPVSSDKITRILNKNPTSPI